MSVHVKTTNFKSHIGFLTKRGNHFYTMSVIYLYIIITTTLTQAKLQCMCKIGLTKPVETVVNSNINWPYQTCGNSSKYSKLRQFNNKNC